MSSLISTKDTERGNFMKIKYIVWKHVILSDIHRLICNTRGEGVHKKGDQAIEFCRNQNPGIWTGFTSGNLIPRKKEVERANKANDTDNAITFNIPLSNSVNDLRIWQDKNNGRKDPIKINHEIWGHEDDYASVIIEPWYLGYMRILKNILVKVKENDTDNPNIDILLNFVSARLSLEVEIRTNVFRWIRNTQAGFAELTLDTSFMAGDYVKSLSNFIGQNVYVIVKCDDDGIEKNMALMANSSAEYLHPEIRQLILSQDSGGQEVDIDVAMASSSPDSQRFLAALSNYHNIILYGPPGTGKTHMLTELMQSFSASVLFDDLDTETPFKVINASSAAPTAWCTFHPSYSYEKFVYGVKPVVINSNLGFKPHIGPFLKQSMYASDGKRALLIIDEINRGRADDIFGNTVNVLNHDNSENVKFTHPINVEGRSVEGISTSDNMFVVGTMNSLDKSTSPLSAELKRRFVIVEVEPSVEVLRSHLQRNSSIDNEIVEFCCKLMAKLNEKIRMFCGKEFELGQGFFWSLVKAKNDHLEVLMDIICNKILPHLKDVLPLESLGEFFKAENNDILFTSNEYGYDFKDLSLSTPEQIINAFAITVDSDYRYEGETVLEITDFEEANAQKISVIREKLLRHHNVIINGVTGTGKSYIVNQIAKDPYFEKVSKMFWHSSTDYSDTIEGISAALTPEGKIDYSVLPGMIKQLADSDVQGPKLMIIEGINKSNPAEALGELITLLEPDKRKLHIEGYEGDIQLPENMYFICTCNPIVENQHKLDSAMKRRFVIANVYPDYKLLSLHLGIIEQAIDPERISLEEIDEMFLKNIAVQLLKRINSAISFAAGTNYQIGHSVFWNLSEKCTLAGLLEIFDNIILPQIEELCFDADVAQKIFGNNSPVINVLTYGVEIRRLSSLNKLELLDALKGLLSHD